MTVILDEKEKYDTLFSEEALDIYSEIHSLLDSIPFVESIPINDNNDKSKYNRSAILIRELLVNQILGELYNYVRLHAGEKEADTYIKGKAKSAIAIGDSLHKQDKFYNNLLERLKEDLNKGKNSWIRKSMRNKG